jgi:hypothetical protein
VVDFQAWHRDRRGGLLSAKTYGSVVYLKLSPLMLGLTNIFDECGNRSVKGDLSIQVLLPILLKRTNVHGQIGEHSGTVQR